MFLMELKNHTPCYTNTPSPRGFPLVIQLVLAVKSSYLVINCNPCFDITLEKTTSLSVLTEFIRMGAETLPDALLPCFLF